MTSSICRRTFLKTFGIAAAMPLAPSTLFAEPESKSAGNRHRILTCNILLDLPEQKGTPEDWAAHRRDVCMKVIKDHAPDILCLQEVGLGQHDDFVKAFPGFASFGYVDPYTDRRPPRFQSAKNVILYSKERYEQTSAGLYWLSKTPLVAGSRMKGEGLPRHVSWVRLKERASGKEFRVLDTQWSLKQPIRADEAQMVASEAGLPYAPEFPQLLAGDFNSVRTSAEHRTLAAAGWKDTYEAVHGVAGTLAIGHKIDFICFRGKVKPVATKMFREHEGEIYPSDHPFVLADVSFESSD